MGIEFKAMNVSVRAIETAAVPKQSFWHSAPRDQTSAIAGLSFEIVTDRAQFNALEDEWTALFARAGRGTQIFQSFNWNWHWANHYLSTARDGQGVQLCTVIGRRDGRLAVVWPLVSERVRGITQVFWMGEPLTQYGDVIIEDTPDTMDVLRAAWRFLSRHLQGDLLRLRRVRADATIAPLLAEIGATLADRQVAPFMDLSSAPDFASFETRYSSRDRKNRRRLARRLDDLGPTRFVRLRGGAQARAYALRALDLKAEWLKSRGLVSAAIIDARTRAFIADAAEGRCHGVDCVVSALLSNEEPAALEISFTCKGRLAMHIIVYDMKFEKCGVGALLLEQSLRDGYIEQLDTYDMLAPGDAYKFDWCQNSVEVGDWVKPLDARGQAYAQLYLRFLRSQFKSALAALPQPLRRLMRDGFTRTLPVRNSTKPEA